MSLSSTSSERAKFGYLLQLAQEQIRALESDDMHTFDRILAARHTIIGSLVDARALVDADPALKTVADQIQECDQSAQRLLYRKVGRIMRALSELQQAKKARRAYCKSGNGAARGVSPYRPETPRFIDQQS